jgi:hypothetical protein
MNESRQKGRKKKGEIKQKNEKRVNRMEGRVG